MQIFGKTWDDLQVVQCDGQTRKVDFGEEPGATYSDRRLLDEHGVEGLKAKGFFGVLNRLETSGLI